MIHVSSFSFHSPNTRKGRAGTRDAAKDDSQAKDDTQRNVDYNLEEKSSEKTDPWNSSTSLQRSMGRIGAGFDVLRKRDSATVQDSTSVIKDFALLAFLAFLLSRISSSGDGDESNLDSTRFYYSSESVQITRTRNADGTVNTNMKRDSAARSNIPGFDQEPRRRFLDERFLYLDE